MHADSLTRLDAAPAAVKIRHMSRIKAYAAKSAGAALEPFEYTPAALGDEQVEIAVDYCGICHSDLSVIRNSWGNAQYPLVPGHEVSNRIVLKNDFQ